MVDINPVFTWEINITAIIIGFISIGIAIGLNIYWRYKEKQNRIKNEMFFVDQITVNLRKMAQYFLDVERTTQHNEEYEESNVHMMQSLETFYLRNEQEMKDVLYQTKLYLPFWNTLSATDKQTVNEILNVFSWLLYEYYRSRLPESLRENVVIHSRNELYAKKNWLMNTTDNLLRN